MHVLTERQGFIVNLFNLSDEERVVRDAIPCIDRASGAAIVERRLPV